MNNFVKGMLISGAVPVVLGPVTAIGVRGSSDEGVQILFGLGWWAVLIAFIVSLIAGLLSRTFRSKDGRAGVLTGIGLGVVAMGASCFAMVSA